MYQNFQEFMDAWASNGGKKNYIYKKIMYMANVSIQTVVNYEKGYSKTKDPKILKVLSSISGVPEEKLFDHMKLK